MLNEQQGTTTDLGDVFSDPSPNTILKYELKSRMSKLDERREQKAMEEESKEEPRRLSDVVRGPFTVKNPDQACGYE